MNSPLKAPVNSRAKKVASKKSSSKKKPSRKAGGVSTFTTANAKSIVARLSAGEPMAAICRDKGMPSVTTVWRWGQDRPDFAQSIARAREVGWDVIAADCLKIADTPIEGVEYTTKPDGGIEEKRGDMLGHRKLQIDTRLKLLAKWDPKRYGERVELAGEVNIKKSAADMTDDELLAIVQAGKGKSATQP